MIAGRKPCHTTTSITIYMVSEIWLQHILKEKKVTVFSNLDRHICFNSLLIMPVLISVRCTTICLNDRLLGSGHAIIPDDSRQSVY